MLIASFSDKNIYRLNELVDSIKSSITDSEKVIAVLRFLIDKEVFALEDDTIRLNEEK